jgi:lysophospholipase L1-like esterase
VRYLALGDSISIDYWTGVKGGGAVSQLAVKIDAVGEDFQDLTADGQTAGGVVLDLERVRIRPEVVTLTAGGNDFLIERPTEAICASLTTIADRLAELGGAVIIATIYDPTDGSDAVGAQIGLAPERRAEYEAINGHIRALAKERGFILSDLQKLFHGHGLASAEPWIHHAIEPNLAGAAAIAEHWYGLLTEPR